MAIYNPASLDPAEFINNEEILATIEYAEQNKNNIEGIDANAQLKGTQFKDLYNMSTASLYTRQYSKHFL